MLKKLALLKGLPGDYAGEIKRYSPDGKGDFREGVVAELTDSRGRVWIGNFQEAGSAGHHLFSSGLGVVLAGPNAYLISDYEAAPTILTSHGYSSRWVDMRPFSQQGKSFLLLVGSLGHLVCLDATGAEVGTAHLDEPCEDVRVAAIDDNSVTGTFYQFTTKRRLPFQFQLPSLSDL